MRHVETSGRRRNGAERRHTCCYRNLSGMPVYHRHSHASGGWDVAARLRQELLMHLLMAVPTSCKGWFISLHREVSSCQKYETPVLHCTEDDVVCGQSNTGGERSAASMELNQGVSPAEESQPWWVKALSKGPRPENCTRQATDQSGRRRN